MATKPRAAKAPVAAKPVARSVKPVAKTAAKPAAKPAAKTPVKAAVKSVVKAPAKAPVKRAATAAPKPAARAPAKRAASVPAAVKRAVKAVVVAAQPATSNPALVRDSFTMPEDEYAVFASAKQRCLQAGVDIKKSELLRIGMALVGQLDVATLSAVLAGLPQLKTGRPRSEQG
jgi:hypothetical protein